jgi:thymidylate kinase
MKNIIIFEGIASSGKTTLEGLLFKRLPSSAILSEGSTLMPIIDNKDRKVALEFLNKQMQVITENPAEDLIIDRFHFTHAFRTQSTLENFIDIENELRKIGHVTIVLLTISEERIKERIEEASSLRKGAWKKGAQGSIDEKVTYYAKQQEILKTFASSSNLPICVIDTTKKDWETYVDAILARVNH